MSPFAKAQLIKSLATELGVDRVGITTAAPMAAAGYYKQWLAAGHSGEMRYLSRNVLVRTEPVRLLAGARSIICAALNYRRADGHVRGFKRGPKPATGETAPRGLVAQYARGRDYHTVLGGLLRQLVECVHARLDETFEARVFVDTGPLLERELAVRAGLGWIGRNACLLNAELGSYLLLGEIVTTLELPPDQPVTERCGACTRCIEACPTQAFVAPGELDARRCISYLTIEHRGVVPPEFHEALGPRVFGCDVCQQVCPYNARAPEGTHPEIMADVVDAQPSLLELLRLRSGDYRRLTRDSASRRARRNMWRRNAAIALRNVAPQTAGICVALTEVARDDDPAVADAARQSLQKT